MSSGVAIVNQPGVLLYDANGNPLVSTDDGGVRKLEVISKQRNTSNTIIDPATETTLATRASEATLATRASEATLATRASEATLATRASEATLGSLESKAATEVTLAAVAAKDFATQSTLETLATQVTAAAVQAVLEAIRDTAGIKKITDALPAGTNNIGDVDVVSSTLPTGAATEATLSSVDSKVATETTLAALEAKAATETTLAALETKAATEATLATLAAKDFSTETTLEAARALLATIDADTSNLDVLLSTRATEATVATLATQATAAAIQTVLEAIRDTAGIKKITDALPVGDNIIGRAKITDGTLVADLIADNSINRLEARNTIVGQVGGTGSEEKVTTIADTEEVGDHRLQTEARLAPGSSVNIGSSIPSDPANLVIEFLTEPGGSENMLVNGSGTAVNFTYAPAAGTSISVSDVLVVFTADDFTFDGDSFGPNAPLVNGVLFQIYADGATTDLFTIHQNEDFLRIPGRIPVINNTGPKDLLSAAFAFGGLIKLHGDDGDYVRMIVRDNITSTKFKYFTATLYGAEI